MKKYSFILQNGSLLCLLQRDENERFTSVSADYTRIPFIGWFTWSWVETLEVIVSWFPFPAKRRRNSTQAFSQHRTLQWRSCLKLVTFVSDHLEQSGPLHPGLQWHLLGRMHRPPFRQGDEHTAVGRAQTNTVQVQVSAHQAGKTKNKTLLHLELGVSDWRTKPSNMLSWQTDG